MIDKSDYARKILAFVNVLPKLVSLCIFLSILPKVPDIIEVLIEYNTAKSQKMSIEPIDRVWYNGRLCYGHELPTNSVSSGGERKYCEETKIHEDKKLTIEEIFELASRRIEKHEYMIRQSCEAHDVDENLLKGLITQESGGDSVAVSKDGAESLTQLMPGTSKELGVKNPFDPKENIDGGTRYLREQLDEFGGNVKLALAAYNAGPEAVKKYNGIPPYKETQNYVKCVLAFKKMYEQKEMALVFLGN